MNWNIQLIDKFQTSSVVFAQSMSSNCEDSSNQQYQLFWFNYFVSIGYIDNSDLVNLYAPYGKCTRGSLWITYLINIIHFFLLSTGVLYLLAIYRSELKRLSTEDSLVLS